MKNQKRKKKSINIPDPWTPCLQRMLSLKLKKADEKIISSVIKKAYLHTDITVEMLSTRKRKLVDTNSILCKVIRQYFRLSYQELGIIFGKHHATIMHYIHSYEEVLCLDSKYKSTYEYLVEVINQKKFGAFDLKSFDITSKNYTELRNAFETLVGEHKVLKEQLIKIKSILDV